MAKLVSKVYGDALFELAKERDILDTVYEEVLVVKKAFLPEIIKIFNSPQINREEKNIILKNIFEGRISKEFQSFLRTVLDKNRQENYISIFDYFIGLYKEYNNIGIAYIKSAMALSEVQKKNIEEKLISTTKYNKFELNFEVDESIIGGLIIRIQDRIVDSSIKTKIYNIKKKLLEVKA